MREPSLLFSMTGYGDARTATPSGAASIEVRSVNNRHLKVTVRGDDPYPMLEAEIEKTIRRHVKRGTLLVQVRVERTSAAINARLNTAVLKAYIDQIHRELPGLSAADRTALLAGALALPGVAPQEIAGRDDGEWPLVEKALEAALEKLNASRKAEGRSMAADLRQWATQIAAELEKIRAYLPRLMTVYQQRMIERVTLAVQGSSVSIEPEHLIREVAIFADRSDVAEEMTRLAGHLAAFEEIVALGGDSAGRRLEFIVQEMGREANTLGSKAGDVTVSRHAVEIKTVLEKIRELVQNVE
jgi:uncharacterized protein (TIGR00255 family)